MAMPKPLLIIVSGLPATGKSVLASKIAREFGFPVIAKDEYKELLADALGVTGAEWSNRLSAASRRLIIQIAGKLLDRGISLIIDANFSPERDNEPLRQLVRGHDVEVVQILCRTEGQTLMERFVQRAAAGERHPIHLEHHAGYEHFAPVLAIGSTPPLDLPGSVIEVDTTDFAGIDEAVIFDRVREAAGGEQ